jgi:hypothetical protein
MWWNYSFLLVLVNASADAEVPEWVEEVFLPIALDGVSKVWIWGPRTPPGGGFLLQESQAFLDRFPRHGFIEIRILEGFEVVIEVVKRPPEPYWSSDESFCSRLLPAAISKTLDDNSIAIDDILLMSVVIRANPYEAACRCYLKTFLKFGFAALNGGPAFNESDIPWICRVGKPDSMEVQRVTYTSPAIPTADDLLLESASFIVQYESI